MPTLDPELLERENRVHDDIVIHYLIEWLLDENSACWVSFTDGHIRDRYHGNITLVEILAGLASGMPRIPPRGFPNPPSNELFYETHKMIVDEDKCRTMSSMQFVTVSQKESWHSSSPVVPAPDFALPSDHGYILDPAIYSPGCLTLEDIDGLLTYFETTSAEQSADFDAAVAAMRAFYAKGLKPRFVFWFTH